MNIRLRQVFAFAALGGAVVVSANASDAKQLIISAPVQKIDRGAETVTVLGQSFQAQTAQMNIGEVVKVYGVLEKDGSVKDAVVEATGVYGANGDAVFLKGIVTASDPAIGHVTVDGLTVDYTSQLANGNFTVPSVGDAIEVSGTEPVAQGVLMASSSGASAYPVAYVASTQSAAASGFNSAGQVSGDVATAGQVSGGAATAEQVGGGTATSEQVGGGTATSEQVGGGTATSEQVGGGTATSEQVGGGTATSEQVGGGTATSEQVGGGTATSEQVGGGTATASASSGRH